MALNSNKVPSADACAPVLDAEAITPSDGGLGYQARTLWIGTAGNVAVKHHPAGSAVTYTNVPVGWFDVSCTHVMATNTTASGIVACV